MKTILLVLIKLFFLLPLLAQDSGSISIGNKISIHSNILNETRNIWVYMPDYTAIVKDSGKQYPVLYLLDGLSHFYSTIGIIQQLSQSNGNGVLPEMIVVAIESTNRFKDFIPDEDANKPNQFTRFLSTELIPQIDKQYPTAPFRLLVGHSLGGLSVIDILGKVPELFKAYIAIDPSMWWDNERFLNHTIKNISKPRVKGKSLFIGTANTMPKGMSLVQLKTDQSQETQHIRSIFRLSDFLKNQPNGLHFMNKYYEQERHNTVPLLTEYDGLRFVFEYYFFDANEKDFSDTTDQLALKLKAHYDSISEKMGYRNAPPESFINYLAYEALSKKHFSKAKALFRFNIDWHPKKQEVFEAYANYFLAVNDTAKAIDLYKRALELKDNELLQAKLSLLNHTNALTQSADKLERYIGVYYLDTYNIPITITIRNNKLWAIVSGQEDEELQMLSEHQFTVKGKQGYTITFTMEGDTPKAFTSVQPNGTFSALFKHK